MYMLVGALCNCNKLPDELKIIEHIQAFKKSLRKYLTTTNTTTTNNKTRICAAEMAVRYAALSACRKVHT